MAGLFLVCAGLPLAALATLTIWQTGDELDARARDRLRYEARSLSQDALTRLNGLAYSLDLAARAVATERDTDNAEAEASQFFSPVPAAAAVRLASGVVVPLSGHVIFPALSAAEERQLSDWGRLVTPDPADQSRLLLLVGEAAPETPRAAAVLDARWMFGLDEVDSLPPMSWACLAPTRGAVQCSPGVRPSEVGPALSGVHHAATDVPRESGDALAWVSSLSLEAQYGAPEWKFLLMRPYDVVRAPLRGFTWNFTMVALMAGLTAGLLTLVQVRRQLHPLAALTEATTRLARHDFDKPVDVTSGDEFQILGEAFNSLSGDLKQQFAELEALNIGTLQTLARAIDAKSPWTAGHSERVTIGAVAIAEAMALPAAQIDQIRRGSLVHDIGKIATPREVLDKPERLTREEEEVMRQHPQKGVHILEPIPALAPVLPIVGQHHEKWNGSGYPAGLAGEAIALTARVVAVADVYDALRSHRPYRAGLAHATVVDVIRHGGGTHFDPSVVQAFLRVESRLGAIDSNPQTGAFARVRQTA